MIYILDASSVIALFREEVGADRVEAILNDEANQVYIHAINLCEVFYDSIRHKTQEYAEIVILDTLKAGVILRDDFDMTFWREVGRMKAVHRASLADFCGIELTRRLRGNFLTADHHELDSIFEEKYCPIEFIR